MVYAAGTLHGDVRCRGMCWAFRIAGGGVRQAPAVLGLGGNVPSDSARGPDGWHACMVAGVPWLVCVNGETG